MLTPLDYGRSFLQSQAEFNAVRFWVESRTLLVDERTGAREVFLQCASCKSERTFAAKDLFQKDNYDFLPIFGERRNVIFRRKAWLNDNYRTVYDAGEPWGLPLRHLAEVPTARLLADNEAVRAATFAAAPIVAQTEIRHAATGLRAIVECPVKTMNIHVQQDLYQVDTGPVAWPDLSRRREQFVDALALAFLAFNAPRFVDVVVERPTAIPSAEAAVCRVHHYSELLTFACENRLYAMA